MSGVIDKTRNITPIIVVSSAVELYPKKNKIPAKTTIVTGETAESFRM